MLTSQKKERSLPHQPQQNENRSLRRKTEERRRTSSKKSLKKNKITMSDEQGS